MPTISAIIPVYNAEQSLKKLYLELKSVLSNLSTEFEIIFVEDCSDDSSWQIINSLANDDDQIQGIKLRRNFGQHNALLCGIRIANNDVIVTLDDDLQNPPTEIPALIEELERGYDVVYGTPNEEQHGILRDMASILTKLALQKGMGVETAKKVSAFRAFRTDLRKGFENYKGPFVSIDVLLTWATSSFQSIPVRHDARAAGKSNYTLMKLFNHAFNMLTGFTTVPLQIASMIGFLFTLFGMGILVWVLGRYLIEGGSIPGFPFLASIIAIFSGVQLFALGVFGEYLARIHFRTMDRPQFLIMKDTREMED